jgi:hypothetical protein
MSNGDCNCHKQSYTSENYNRNFHNKSIKQSELRRLILFLRVRCSILILLIKSVCCSIPSL